MPKDPSFSGLTAAGVEILAMTALPPVFRETGFVFHELSRPDGLDALVAQVGSSIRGVVTPASNAPRFTAALMDRLPRLEIIVVVGAGFDIVDLDAAASRGVTVTNTPDVLNEDVADLTLGLLIAAVRRIPQADRFVRGGEWTRGSFPLSRSLQGRFVGLVGLGRVGKAVARRCEAFGLEVGYFGRTRQDNPYPYFASLIDLARRADVLIVTVAGGDSTRNLVDAPVLAALGENGVLINVARGSVVDEPALIEALRGGRLQAAGLDVYPNEPNVSPDLQALSNVVLLPHMGSATRETRGAMVALALKNLVSWFKGDGPVTPVVRAGSSRVADGASPGSLH